MGGRRRIPETEKEAWQRVSKYTPRLYSVRAAPAMAVAQQDAALEQSA